MATRSDTIHLLIRYLRRELSEEEQAKVASLLAGDAEVRAMLRMVEALRAFIKPGQASQLQQAAKQLADRLFRDFHQPPEDDRVPVGVTVFDSALLPIPEGVRPAQIDTRQLRYRFGEFDLVLMLYPVTPDSFEVMGQVAGDDLPTSLSMKLQSDAGETSADIDEHGLFRFDRVSVGDYRLLLLSEDTVSGIVKLSL